MSGRLTIAQAHCPRRQALQALVMACLFALAACSKPSTSTSQPASSQPRIVSLSPAISRTLVDLYLAKFVVGRTPYCSSLDQSIPVVGDLQTVDYEALIRLNPTHILVQPPAAGLDPHLVDLATRQGWTIGQWRLNGIVDIRLMLKDLPATVLPAVSPERAAAEHAVGRMMDYLEPVDVRPLLSSFKGRVLLVSGTDPVLAFGNGTYLNDALLMFGVQNAVRDQGWVQLSLEDIVRLAPEAIILVKPGGDVGELTRDLGALATIDVPAVRHGRLALLRHPDALLPSSAVTGVLSEVRAILNRFAENASASDNRP